MKASLLQFFQRAKPHALSVALACAVTAAAGVAWAQTRISPSGVNVTGSVIGDDVLYSIGGGRAVSMGPVGQMQSLGVGIGWNSNL
ncbi:MAG: integrating conjugative element protein, partial [Rhodoferax sp.]|nr:integrating conjugative element protein [Rhodoferax sp.]